MTNASELPTTDSDELVDAANDLTVAITEALLEETALDEDTDIADIERWGERTEKLILARIQADAATIARMREALEIIVPWAEQVEDEHLVGDEGCLWPVEIARAALKGGDHG